MITWQLLYYNIWSQIQHPHQGKLKVYLEFQEKIHKISPVSFYAVHDFKETDFQAKCCAIIRQSVIKMYLDYGHFYVCAYLQNLQNEKFGISYKRVLNVLILILKLTWTLSEEEIKLLKDVSIVLNLQSASG